MTTDLATLTVLEFDDIRDDYALEVLKPRQLSTEAEAQVADFLSDLSAKLLFPTLKKNKGEGNKSGDFTLLVGGQKHLFPGGRESAAFLDFALVEIGALRTLWSPEDSADKKPPICRTHLLRQSEVPNAVGQWDVNSGFEAPDGNARPSCSTCPWNVFGSAARWKGKEGLGSKACGETRTMMLMPMRRVKPVPGLMFGDVEGYYYDLDWQWFAHAQRNPHGLLFAQWSMSSDKGALDEMKLSTAKHNQPMPGLVFRIKVHTESAGQVTFGKILAQPVGLTGSEKRVQHLIGLSEWAWEWMKRNVDYLTQQAAPEGVGF